ncbi:two-component system regulatory protein YycI [Bacillus sp. FJAT-49705]|uniref:Two-component system regulatory protein YycI n=1 Tax=Cytobacillus citreus TaxID=2833586 RepID=A0ABS5NQL8_9BACI|nr:two-component system regulatory protein YycI [Cytobacillus citreus]MBS4189861.1 two-component system regulatory protein YycI [Cytobacillus citreus]
MDWSRIKTIFILTFLVLDIYLMYEFFTLKDSSQYEYITETSLEKKLQAAEIEYKELPKNHTKDMYLSAKPKNFNNELIESLEKTKLKGQDLEVSTDNALKSILDKPYDLKDKFEVADVNSFVKNNVLNGDQYRFWKKEGSTIYYYQQFNDKVFYHNNNGQLAIYLTEENDIASYRQTMLEDIEEISKEEKIIQPLKAIEALYENNSLEPKSKITKVELGYFTFDQTSTTQVLTPAWRFVIEDKEDLFVNAFEGQVFQLNTEDKNIVE